jgi:3-phosphoglycerate kinase
VKSKSKAAALKDGEVLMLENVRFHKEEKRTILLLQKSCQLLQKST